MIVLFRILFTMTVITACMSAAEAQEVRTLVGQIGLDLGVADTDLVIDVTVNNHSFIVVPPFTIIRPITSKETRQVVLEQGSASVSYLVDNVITNPVDYTVQFDCVGCTNTFRRQYYAPGGNRFGFANPVYLDPPGLGPNLDVTIITDARISGSIRLADSELAKRDLQFEVNVVSDLFPELVYASLPVVSLPRGSASVNYEVRGLRREIGSSQFSVRLKCKNCIRQSGAEQVFVPALSASQNHQNIDFIVTDAPVIPVAPMIDLLLDGDAT